MTRGRAYALVAAAGLILAVAAHAWATAQRGYEAIGGEVLLVFMPLWAWMVETVVGTEADRASREEDR